MRAGANWVVTAHEAEIEVLEEFRERAEGGSQIGALDSPSFVAAVVEWVVTSYFRAFEDVEQELEELDAKVMSEIPKNVADELGGSWSCAAPSALCDGRYPRTVK